MPWQISTSSQPVAICKLTEGALRLPIQVINKGTEQNRLQYQPMGNTTCDWSPAGFNSIHHHSLGLALQPVLYSAKSVPVQAMSYQLLQGNILGDSVKGFTEVLAGYVHSLSLIHQTGHLIMEEDQVGQAGPAFRKPMLAGPDPLVVPYMPCDCTQDYLFHDLLKF